MESFHSAHDRPGGGNASGWRNARVDELLDAMVVEFDEEKRNEMFHEVNRLFYAEQPETLLVHGLVGVLVNKRFEGLTVRPTGLQAFDFWVEPENVRHR
jgi:ABC-type transport system substrate-binding protein